MISFPASTAGVGSESVTVSRPSRLHFKSLDGFRGLAFLLVFMRHYVGVGETHSSVMRVVNQIGGAGWMGVDLFFALSGFLITGILLDTREQPGYFSNFYARRSLRIFPLYYGFFLVLALVTPLLHLQWRAGHIAYLFYLSNIAYNLDPTICEIKPAIQMIHFWSLAVEEQFYLLWPVLIFLIRSRKTLIRTCFALSVGGLLLRGGLMLWSPSRGIEWAYAELPTHMDGLLAGALAAIWFRSVAFETLLGYARKLLVVSAALLVCVIAWSGTADFSTVSMTLLGYPLLAILFACFLLLALQPGTVANRFGSLPVLRFFGKYSYGMYVFHIAFAPMSVPLHRALEVRLHSVVLGGLAYVAVMFFGTILLALLSYNLYEKHWLQLKSKFSNTSSKKQLVAT